MLVRELPSARLRDAHSNFASFIQRARDSAAFGLDLDFDAAAWDLSRWHRVRPSTQQKKLTVYFTTHENGDAKGLHGRRLMLRPFGDFIKAVVRLRHESNPRQSKGLQVLVRASRYLHDTLIERLGDPCSIRTEDFDKAAQACKARENESSQYRIGLWLEEIAGWLNKYAISKGRIDFTNPFPRVSYDHTRIGKKHDERRAKKLPSSAAYDALGRISNLVGEPSEVVRMRAIEILVAGGFRINECLTLPEDCEIEEELLSRNGKPESDREGRRQVRYGLRYQPEKGGRPDVKWIPTAMIDVVRRAVRDIRIHTAPARKTAKWLESHPGRASFDLDNDQGPGQIYSSHDIAKILGISRGGARLKLSKAGILPATIVKRMHCYHRVDIEAVLLSAQELLDPLLSMPLSDYLFVVPQNFCHSGKTANPSVVLLLTDQQIGDFLAGRNAERRVRSVFDRYGFTEVDGSPIRLTSHMFRHWLDTLFEQGGLGQHEIARWFGRKDMGQNAAYDHVTGMQKAEEVHRLMESGKMRGPMAQAHEMLAPIDRAAFRETAIVTAHTTDLGLCITDWSLAPCPDHGSCARCAEQLVVKGDPKQKEAAEELLAEHERFLAEAIREAEEDTYGASNYVAHHRSMVEGLRRILAVHNDPDIPNYTLVHLNSPMPSRLVKRALEEV